MKSLRTLVLLAAALAAGSAAPASAVRPVEPVTTPAVASPSWPRWLPEDPEIPAASFRDHGLRARVVVRGRPGVDGTVRRGQARLVVTSRSGTVRAPLPAGPTPGLHTTPLRSAGRTAVVVTVEEGDRESWLVYELDGDALRRVPASRQALLGGGFTRTQPEAIYASWTARHGRGLFTRIGTARPHRYDVLEWRWTGARLRATDLGVVCLPDRVGARHQRGC